MTQARKHTLPGLLFLCVCAGCGSEPAEPVQSDAPIIAPEQELSPPSPPASTLLTLDSPQDHIHWLEADSMADLAAAQIERYFTPRETSGETLLPDYADAVRVHGDPWELAGPPDFVPVSGDEGARVIAGPYYPHEATAFDYRAATHLETELAARAEETGAVVAEHDRGQVLVAAPVPATEDCRQCHDALEADYFGALLMRLREIADD